MSIEVGTLTSKGQITIPIAIREKLELKQGDKVLFIEDTDGIRIVNATAFTFKNQKEAVAKKE